MHLHGEEVHQRRGPRGCRANVAERIYPATQLDYDEFDFGDEEMKADKRKEVKNLRLMGNEFTATGWDWLVVVGAEGRD